MHRVYQYVSMPVLITVMLALIIACSAHAGEWTL